MLQHKYMQLKWLHGMKDSNQFGWNILKKEKEKNKKLENDISQLLTI